MKKTLLLLLMPLLAFSQNLKTPFETKNGNQTVTYGEMVNFYDQLDAKFHEVMVKIMGLTDSGEPLRLVLYNAKGDFNLKNAVILINNGIHPGEPDGIDASMQLVRDLAERRLPSPKNTTIAIIECYNIGGMLNRGKFSRANQNGPEEYGFRGNARNYDLNRDFIKTDSRNAKSFQEIFHALRPVYFIDNHVSNGADYQYTLTYITTNRERLGGSLGDFQHDVMVPAVKSDLLKEKIISAPYVEINGLQPEKGYEAFMDSPRYATGYTALFNTMGEVPETHMLKPYKDRVYVTYKNMAASIKFVDENIERIKKLQADDETRLKAGDLYPIAWKLDSTKHVEMDFRGYKAGLKPSQISGKPRLFYDRKKPYTQIIPFYNRYSATKNITIPKYYIVPQSEWKVVEQLKRNQIEMHSVKKDSAVQAEIYHITDYKSTARPYEGHYLHYETQVKSSQQKMMLRAGDFLVPTSQAGIKYLLETLEPEAVDSFFNWNYFDSILGQKEYFSDYVFEDTGAEILKKDANLRAAFEKKKREDPKFAGDGRAQLDWVYRNSEYFETSYLRYPIVRVLN